MKKLKVKCFFDGACDPNPDGAMGFGVYIESNIEMSGGCKLSNGEAAKKGNTNNIAEYKAVLGLLNWLRHDPFKQDCEYFICGDSRLVVMQLRQDWKVKSNPQLRSLRDECLEIIEKLKSRGNEFYVAWIPREQNKLADELSKQGMQNFIVTEPQYSKL